MAWRSSSHSGSDGTQCVQVAALAAERVVAARDSKDPDGAILLFLVAEWSDFLTEVKAGRVGRL
jgi:hypothetical protein